jgi:NAD(P)-dependent dehydrogenase (short-subunit alcohol dehydrogenase family)
LSRERLKTSAKLSVLDTLNELPSKQDLLDDVAKEIREKWLKKVLIVPGDVSKEDVATLVDMMVKELGGLDVVSALLF